MSVVKEQVQREAGSAGFAPGLGLKQAGWEKALPTGESIYVVYDQGIRYYFSTISFLHE